MKFLKYALAVISLVLPLEATIAQEQIVIRFSHVVSSDAPKGKAALKFAELAKERTAGRVRVDVFPNSRLFGDNDEMVSLLAGHVEMLAPSLSKFKVLRTKDFEVFDLPYLFSDMEAVHRVTEGEVGKNMLNKLDKFGVVGLAFWDSGFKQLSANRPLRTLDDINGLKVRIQPSSVIYSTMTAFGAKPRPLDFNEVYASLKSGFVEGTEGTAANFYTQNLHYAQKYLTLTNHGYLGYAVIANKNFWDNLPAEIRAILAGAMHDASLYANRIALESDLAALNAIKTTGKTQIIELTAAESAKLRAVANKIHKNSRVAIGKELVDSVHQAADYKPSRQ